MRTSQANRYARIAAGLAAAIALAVLVIYLRRCLAGPARCQERPAAGPRVRGKDIANIFLFEDHTNRYALHHSRRARH